MFQLSNGDSSQIHLVDYFRLFIVATGCPSERRPQKTLSCYGVYIARIQDETTENSAWFFNVLGVLHRHTGPRFLKSHPKDN